MGGRGSIDIALNRLVVSFRNKSASKVSGVEKWKEILHLLIHSRPSFWLEVDFNNSAASGVP